MDKQKQMRCGLYIRVSTEGQVKKGESLEVQLKRLKARVSINADWGTAKEYHEGGLSAKNTTGRPEFQELKADVEAGALDIILCTKLDRIFRNTQDCLEKIKFFEA